MSSRRGNSSYKCFASNYRLLMLCNIQTGPRSYLVIEQKLKLSKTHVHKGVASLFQAGFQFWFRATYY